LDGVEDSGDAPGMRQAGNVTTDAVLKSFILQQVGK
jgi:hypothetical protein